MIIIPENFENIKLNIFLKNGEVFKNKDTTNQPLGENEKVVGFWHNKKLKIYPMEQIDHIEMIFDEN